MPLYEYQCQKCKDVFEVTQKFSDKPLKKCRDSKCKGGVKKLISQSGFALKGTGFYTTDYKRKSEVKPAAPAQAVASPTPNVSSEKPSVASPSKTP